MPPHRTCTSRCGWEVGRQPQDTPSTPCPTWKRGTTQGPPVESQAPTTSWRYTTTYELTLTDCTRRRAPGSLTQPASVDPRCPRTRSRWVRAGTGGRRCRRRAERSSKMSWRIWSTERIAHAPGTVAAFLDRHAGAFPPGWPETAAAARVWGITDAVGGEERMPPGGTMPRLKRTPFYPQWGVA